MKTDFKMGAGHLNEELGAAIVADTKGLMAQKKEAIEQEWLSLLEDLSEDIPEREPLLTQESSGNVLLYKRGIHVVKGKQKAGKTFYNAILMTALTNPNGYCDLVPSTSNLKVLFIDTEQDQCDVRKVANRVHQLNKWPLKENQSNYRFASLRGNGIEERISIIEKLLERFKPDVVVIDGVVDLCHDFNSPQESHEIVTQLMKWTEEYNVAIITTLHTNKSEADKNMRGHLGTILAQKADSVIDISKKKGEVPYIESKMTDSRHKPINNFAFTIIESSTTGNALPEYYEMTPQSKSSIDLQRIFESVLTKPLRNKDLRLAVMDKAGIKTSSADRYIKSALVNGIIINSDGLYELS